ncbi:MAG: UvrB/UvrC motif-containing protein [Planctomycetota bacterium]|nr:UvrB/UvrC motif-containing protein [Planctomycetota bacterium]
MSSQRQTRLMALRDKAAGLPKEPGVYLFKDDKDVVLYVGKAKDLRSRVSSYLQPSVDLRASRGPEIARLIDALVVDVDVLVCPSEVDALLQENRQPRFNERLRDGKSYPYLQIRTKEDFPRVEITRAPERAGVALYGPFVSVNELRSAVPLMQRVFKFRTCKLDIAEADESRGRFRPCILHAIKQCTAPCAARVSRADYGVQIKLLRAFLDSKGSQVRRELEQKMQAAAAALEYERAAELRDELRAFEGLQKRGLASDDLQPEVFSFPLEAGESLARLGEVLGLPAAPRSVEGVDIAHLAGGQICGAVVSFIDGKSFKDAYRWYKIKTVAGNDDFACIREVVYRRYKHAGMNAELFPDVILIDGGKGQLSAARSAFEDLAFTPPTMIALAKKEEEVHVHGRPDPIRLPRHDAGLRLLQAVRDEAHRFVQRYHHILRKKATLGED